MQIAVNLTTKEAEALELRGRRNKRSMRAEATTILKAVAAQEIGPDPLEVADRIRASLAGRKFRNSADEIREMREERLSR